MKVTIVLNVEDFAVSVSQEGEINTTKEARQLMALCQQAFPGVTQSITELHAQLAKQEEAAQAQMEAPMEVAAEPELVIPEVV